MAFDTVRGRIVLFGGIFASYLALGDTWEWDGSAWTQQACSGPSPRVHPTMAYDSNHGRVVLFGGGSAFALGDTWEYSGCSSSIYYRDADSDGFGDEGVSQIASTAPPGYANNAADCDDAHAAVHPDAPEICDGLRNDCRAAGWPAIDDADSDGAEQSCDICPFDPLDDSDSDGLCGDADNCATLANPQSDCDVNAGTPVEQCDSDAVGLGDVCDNCPSIPNMGQFDNDRDGTGSECDADSDGDGTLDTLDADDDGDGVPEDDGDGTFDPCPDRVTVGCDDNCPLEADSRQVDRDGDGQGDVCDLDDGVVNGDLAPGAIVAIPLLGPAAPPKLAWVRETGALGYNVYRSALNELYPGNYGAWCYRNHLTATYTLLPEAPPPGVGYGYLVTAIMPSGEGSMGTDSAGNERPNSSPCP